MSSRRDLFRRITLYLLCAVAVYLAPPIIQVASAPAAEEQTISLPILMYHSLLRDTARSNAFVVTPTVFEQDLQFLRDHGYQTIVMQDLINYVYKGCPLPDKPVMITFDDGQLNTLTYGVPILQQYQARAVVSIVGSYVERAEKENDHSVAYSYATWDELAQMLDSGTIELQSHSYQLHDDGVRRGAVRKKGEPVFAYRDMLSTDVERMRDLLSQHLGITVTTFTYPYGFVDADAETLLREMGFVASLACYEHVNSITRSPDCLFSLGRFNRPAGISTERFMHKALGTTLR